MCWGGCHQTHTHPSVPALLRAAPRYPKPSVPSVLCCRTFTRGCSARWHRERGIHTRPTATGGLCQLLQEKGKKRPSEGDSSACTHFQPAEPSGTLAKSITVPPREEITDGSHSLPQNRSSGLKWLSTQRTSTPFSSDKHNAEQCLRANFHFCNLIPV